MTHEEARTVRRSLVGILMILAVASVGPSSLAADYPTRTPVTLPADVKAIFLAQMLGHVVSLDAVMTALGTGDYATAAEVARSELAVSRFQKSAGEGQDQQLGVGEHLPEAFRAIGIRFREASQAFAEAAAAMPDAPSAAELQALIGRFAKVTNACRDCHDSYRIE